MIKRIVLILVVGLFIAGCEESNPPVDFGKATEILKDTIYRLAEADIPDANQQNILIEDLTGVRCSNCPQAAESAKTVKDTFGSRVVVIGSYTKSPGTTQPFAGYPDLRTEEAQLISTNIFEIVGLPAGGVNRKIFSGQSGVNINQALWLNSAIEIFHDNAIVNIKLSKKKVNDTTFEITGKLVFTEQPLFNPFVSIALLENNILHPQKLVDATVDYGYIHQHVLRKMYTPYNGTPIFKQDDIQPDRGVVVERIWLVNIPQDVNVEESSIAVYINYNDASNQEVLQCMEIKLK